MAKRLERTDTTWLLANKLLKQEQYILPVGYGYRHIYEYIDHEYADTMSLFPKRQQKGSDDDRIRFLYGVLHRQEFKGISVLRQDKRTGRIFHVQGVLALKGILYSVKELCDLFQNMDGAGPAEYEARGRNKADMVTMLCQTAKDSEHVEEPLIYAPLTLFAA